MEVSEPKQVNSIYNIIGVNSLMPRGLHMLFIILPEFLDSLIFLYLSKDIYNNLLICSLFCEVYLNNSSMAMAVPPLYITNL